MLGADAEKKSVQGSIVTSKKTRVTPLGEI